MTKPIIGIIGSTGLLGNKLIDFLTSKTYQIKGAHRNKDTKKVIEYDEYIFDISNLRYLDNFVKECDIVVNCSGPSFHVRDSVLKIAIKYQKDYIDPFGDEFILKNIKEQNIPINSRIIISCGDYPGFTGIIPFWLKSIYFDSIDYIEINFGTNEKVSSSGLCDLLLSNAMGFGKANYFYKNERLFYNGGKIKKKYNSYLNKNIFISEFINNEIINASEKINIKESHFGNIYFYEDDIKEMQNVYFNIVESPSIDDMLFQARKASEILNNREKGNIIKIYNVCADGIKNKIKKQEKFDIISKSSVDISSFMMKESIDLLRSDDIKNGIYRPFDLFNAISIVNKMIRNSLILEINYYNEKSSYSKLEIGEI